MLLDDKTAIIYGGGGAIGSAVSRAFAREGARVYVAGLTWSKLEQAANEIRAAGGVAEPAELDALDERAVIEHADAVAGAAGRIDISFNLISYGVIQGTPMVDMDSDDYLRPVTTAVRTMFLTSRAAARHMIRQGSGVILAFGGDADPPPGLHLGSLQICFHAIEAMRRQLASELGQYGIRTVTLRTGGVPEAIPSGFAGREVIAKSIEDATLLGRAGRVGHGADDHRHDDRHQRRHVLQLGGNRRNAEPFGTLGLRVPRIGSYTC
jgi:3-oxoacyl-[acyl-carrier protein] reductase